MLFCGFTLKIREFFSFQDYTSPIKTNPRRVGRDTVDPELAPSHSEAHWQLSKTKW
jgi:hypothetical protein